MGYTLYKEGLIRDLNVLTLPIYGGFSIRSIYSIKDVFASFQAGVKESWIIGLIRNQVLSHK